MLAILAQGALAQAPVRVVLPLAAEIVTVDQALSWLPPETWVFAVDEMPRVPGDASPGFPWIDPLDKELSDYVAGLFPAATLRWEIAAVHRFTPRSGQRGKTVSSRILRFEGDLSRATAAFDQIATSKHVRSRSLAGRPVIGLGPARERDAWITRPESGVLVLANDTDAMEAILAASTDVSKRTDWAAYVPHWNRVDRGTGKWIVNRELDGLGDGSEVDVVVALPRPLLRRTGSNAFVAPDLDDSYAESLTLLVLSRSTAACRTFAERQLQCGEAIGVETRELDEGVLCLTLRILREPRKSIAETDPPSDEEIECVRLAGRLACCLGVCFDF